LFETWCTDKRNGVLIAGYSVEGTLAKHLMSEPEEVSTMSGQKLARKCSIDYISFSAHTDYEQTSHFVRVLRPPHIVLVHGEQNEMARLKAALIREYEDNEETNIIVYNPKNTEKVDLHFRGEKMAKVIGSLAAVKPRDGHRVSGVLVKKGFSYQIVSPSELSAYTDLATSVIKQRQTVAFSSSLSVLDYYLQQLAGDVEQHVVQGKAALRVFGSITVVRDKNGVILEWIASPVNDMYADAVLSTVLQIESDPSQSTEAVVDAPPVRLPDDDAFPERVIKLLQEVFGEERVDMSEDGLAVIVSTDTSPATIDIDTLEITCIDDSVLSLISSAMKRLHVALTPCQGSLKP
jgi:cleavage and polyadenylation specificity factor subunit 3